MKITWIGHSCFLIESGGYRIVIDPYEDGSVPGLRPVRVEADQVLCSHDHHDHAGVSCVSIREESPASPFAIQTLPSWHDGHRGAKRGPNTIHILDDGQIKLAHLGDLGCRPEPDQMELLSGLDVILIPVGGFYTINGEQAASLVTQMRPRITIPMHYRGESFGYDVISTAEDFLDLEDEITCLDGSELEVTKDGTKGIIVLDPLNAE